MTTSPSCKHNFIYSEGNIKLHRTKVKVNKSQKRILKEMKDFNIYAEIDSIYLPKQSEILNFYVIDKLVIR